MVHIHFAELKDKLSGILGKQGFDRAEAEQIARIFSESTFDGVFSHGINRFPRFIQDVENGIVTPGITPALISEQTSMEQWDGLGGAGISNALFCSERCMKLAHENGMACVGLRNTNHWMRGGSYGLQAADAGCIGICWTNTTVLMPPWGSMEAKLGNNPLIICVPRKESHLLFDAAMSQFSIGRLLITAKTNEKLPVPGGFDEQGNLTDDPEEILKEKNPLPIGFWKGSGLALLLDCVVSVLSTGQATSEIGGREDETNVSQMFIAIDLEATDSLQFGEYVIDSIINDLHTATPISENNPVTFPGERMLQKRLKGDKDGIVVDADIWRTVKAL